MKTITTSILLFFIFFHSNAQNCGTGSVLLNSQTDVDNFITTYSGTCNTIDFNLTINGPSISDLSGLSFIEYINAGLIIDNTTISSLSGLENLNGSGYIRIQNNPNIMSIELPVLNSINSSFYFNNNTSLTQILIPQLLNFNGNRLEIINNPNLSLINITNIFSFSTYITIEDNPVLTNLDFLLNLSVIGGNITIQNNALLNSCCFLKNYFDGYLLISGTITLMNNLTNCNSLLTIDAVCNIRDLDEDGIFDDVDNCPTLANATQIDSDNNGIGDACQSSSSINTGSDAGGVGINTTSPHALLEIAEGDIFLNNIHRGVILKAANGKCFRYRPNEYGELKGKEINCPDN